MDSQGGRGATREGVRLLAADREAGPISGRFRRRTALVDPHDGAGEVARAVARAQQGDEEAIRFLYVRFADNIYGYVRAIVRDEHDAEDLTQHVFAKLITVIQSYQPRGVPFSAWILRVARNVAVDHMRRIRAVPCAEVRAADEPADELSFERRRCLTDALGALPEDQRGVVVLRLLGLSPHEIAAQLGRSEASVHGLHHRGRRALQRSLVEMGFGPATIAA